MRPLGLLAFFLFLCACSQEPALPSYGLVPVFQLIDQNGQHFDSATALGGKVWIADFIFTTCAGPCPRMSRQMRQLQQQLRNATDLRFVSFTVDPDRDTPQVLSAYARRHGADLRQWTFLTGPQERLHALARHAFFLNNVDGSLEHSTRFVLVDRKSRIRGYYDTSDEQSLNQLAQHARRLLAERW